jgi:hypothetical protein
MIGLGKAALKIFVALESCDMRKFFNGPFDAAVRHLNDGKLGTDMLFGFSGRTRSSGLSSTGSSGASPSASTPASTSSTSGRMCWEWKRSGHRLPQAARRASAASQRPREPGRPRGRPGGGGRKRKKR